MSDDAPEHDVLKYYVPSPVPLWFRVAEWVVIILIAAILALFIIGGL